MWVGSLHGSVCILLLGIIGFWRALAMGFRVEDWVLVLRSFQSQRFYVGVSLVFGLHGNFRNASR